MLCSSLFIYRFLIKLPKGTRIMKVSDVTQGVRSKNHENLIQVTEETSLLDQLSQKLKSLSNINIDLGQKKDNNQIVSKNFNEILKNLQKCGLIIRKESDMETYNMFTNVEKINTKCNRDLKENINSENTFEEIACNINEAIDYITQENEESEYEIETLEESDSDFEYIPPMKKNDKDTKTNKKIDLKTKKTGEFIKIKSTNFMCVMCHIKFNSLSLLMNHIKSPTPCCVISVTCPICGKEFPNKSRCSSHMQIHKEKPKFFCDKCGKVFSNTIALMGHLEMMHTEYFDAIGDKFQCKLCDHEAFTKQSVLHHINTSHLHVSTFLCHVCGKSFLNENSLKNHLMIHRDIKPFLCQICSKAFKTQCLLQAHIKTHSQEKRFVCDECGKLFKKNFTLQEHKKCHSGAYCFKCFVCEKQFVSKTALNTHLKIH